MSDPAVEGRSPAVDARLPPVDARLTVLSPAAVSSAGFSAVARTGIDLASLATWDPTLARPPRMLVPVDVQALVVGPHDVVTHVPVLAPLVNPQNSSVLDITQAMPAVPPFSPAVQRPPGVYLHWAAPDGLTQTKSPLTPAQPSPGNQLGSVLPPLADRWLVVRVGGGAPRRTRGWVIESERCRLVDLATWVPTGAAPATNLGTTPDLPPEQLTAAAGGDPGWAALFDAVQDRFAMYDDLSDLDPADSAGPLSYLVCGWWSKDSNDPLYVPDLASFVDTVSTMKWSFPPVPAAAAGQRDLTAVRAASLGYTQDRVGQGAAIDSAGAATSSPLGSIHRDIVAAAGTIVSGQPVDHPRLTLLHGSVYGILPEGGGVDPIPAAASIEVAVGITGTEAFAAIVAGSDPSQNGTDEQLIEAFSLGLISRLDTSDGLVDLDQAVHASGFAAQAGSTERNDRLVSGNRLAEGAASVAGSLTNLQQAAAAKATSAAASSTAQAGERRADLLVERPAAETIAALSVKQSATGTAPDPNSVQVRVVPVASEPWWTPVNPVVTLRGATRSLRHGYDGRFTSDQTLACRVSGTECTVFSGLIAGADIVGPLGNGGLPPECDELLRELVLDDPYRLADTASAAATATGLPLAAVTDRLTAEHALRWDTAAPVAGKDLLRAVSMRAGMEPSPVATTAWEQPWVPLYLEWRLSLRVDGNLARWALSDVDLEPTGDPSPGASVVTRVLSGRSLLTSVGARTFSAQVASFLAQEAARVPRAVCYSRRRTPLSAASPLSPAPSTS